MQLQLSFSTPRVVRPPAEPAFKREMRFICNHEELTDRTAWSEPHIAQSFLNQILEGLKEVASHGQLFSVINMKFRQTDAGSLIVAIKKIEGLVDFSKDFALLPSFGHSPFCHHWPLEHKVSIPVSWQPDNPHVNPKPQLSLSSPTSWGVVKLNEKRKSAEGTDGAILFGTERFPVHLEIIFAFSRTFEVRRQFGEGQRKEISLEAVQLTREQLDLLVTYMYTREMDLSGFSDLDVLELFKWSLYVQADQLRALAFKRLYDRAQELGSADRLFLLFIEMQQPFPELTDLCRWLMRQKPDFYQDILKDGEVSSENLIKLMVVSQHYCLISLQETLLGVWKTLPTSDKVQFLNQALQINLSSLLRRLELLCKEVVREIPATDPARGDFVKAFKRLMDRLFEEEIKPSEEKEVAPAANPEGKS